MNYMGINAHLLAVENGNERGRCNNYGVHLTGLMVIDLKVNHSAVLSLKTRNCLIQQNPFVYSIK